MPAPALLVVLLALLIGNVLLIATLATRRRAVATAANGEPLTGEPVDLAIEMANDPDGGPASGSGIRLATYDRVVRIVSYTFFLLTAMVVAVGDLWPGNAAAIYLLLVAGAALVFAFHEVAPRVLDVATLFLVEGIAAVTFFTVLVILTGGVESPYFFGYFLIVAAAALVTGGGASLVLAAAITAAYLGALLLTRGGQPYTPEQVVIVAVDLMALWLLSYLASVVAGEQRRTRDAALRLSLHDPLTRLYNRTFLFAVIEREIARASRTSRRFSLLMLDLDGLKPINDRFGHYFGDRMLQAVAEAIRQHIRLIDTAARYGGDEFVVLLPETDTAGAAVVAEKLRRSVAAIRLNAGMDLLSSTASIGVVAFPEDGRTADALTHRADQVMYGAKRAGRDRVNVDPLGGMTANASALPSAGSAARRGSAPVDARAVAAGSRARQPSAGRPATRQRTRPTRTRRRRGASQEPRISMFTAHYPTLSPWDRPPPSPWSWDRPVGQAGEPPVRPPAATGVSPMTATRTPSARARRFLVDLSDDRTFERTMSHFLGAGSPERGSKTARSPEAPDERPA